MNKITFFFLTGICCVLLFDSCNEKDEVQPSQVKGAVLNLRFAVGNNVLQYDSLLYTNSAGNNYSVSRLQFYLSRFEFEETNGAIYCADTVIYIDARNNINTILRFERIPFSDYKRLKFYIGLDSLNNISGSLPHTIENENMAWPDFMGGGYHFMKLEGNFISQAQVFGYAMHLGMNESLVVVNLVRNFNISAEANTISLKMNLNEWFANPSVYDFNVDGNYSMGDSTAMQKLAGNGVDVFSFN